MKFRSISLLLILALVLFLFPIVAIVDKPVNAATLPAQCPGVIDDYNVILGGSGSQTLDGTAGKDFIDGGGGDDTINGNGGDDCIDGGGGDDIIITTSGNDVILGGGGANTINAGDGNNTIISGNGKDTITTTGSGTNSIDAGGGTNIITTGDGADTITSGNGSDTINSGGGNDIITTGGGTNIVNAGAGNDTVNADGSNNDTIHGDDGDDTINDTGGGTDTLYGDDGNDTITFTGSGNDSAFGGSGDDTITESPIKGGTDSADGGTGCDTVSVDGASVPDSDCATIDVTAPAVIPDLATSNPTTSSITLSWTAPGDDADSGTATVYDIRYRTNNINNESKWNSATQATGEPSPSVAGTSETMIVSGLSADTTYYFAIKTSDEVPNESDLSNVVSETTQTSSDTTAPAAVADLAASGPSNSAITLSWTAPGDDGSSGTASFYDIRYSTNNITAGNWSSATQATGEPTPSIAGSSETMIVSGLSADTTYYFAIKTSDEVPNESDLSNVVSETTQTSSDTTAPAAVADLAASSPSNSAITLTWTAPGDDGSSGTASSYDIRYSTGSITDENWSEATQVSGEPVPLAAGTAQSMTVIGLAADTTYFFALKTADEVPNTAALSNVPSLATLAGSTPAPSGGSSGSVRPTTVTFLGKAFPNATILVVDKDARFEQVVSQNIVTNEGGAFRVDFVGIIQVKHSFGLIIKDSEGRPTQTKFFNIDTHANDLVVKDILVPPTVDFIQGVVTRGRKAVIIGYAAPENNVKIEVGDIQKEIKAEKDGSYKAEIDTGVLAFGQHKVRVKQIDLKEKKESDFSVMKTLVVSRLVSPRTDLSGDGRMDIKDWSMFLSSWGSKDESRKKIIDFNDDGKINISDFSIFIRAVKK